jgi:signal peptidase
MVRILALAVLLAVAGLTAALVLPVLWGEPSRIIIVSGESMEPTFHTGDLIVVWPRGGYDTGDVAPYRVPEGEPGEGGLVIHRVVGGDGTDGYVMQGDNNPTPDIWMPTDDDVIGRQVLAVPKVGEVLAWIRQPGVLAAVAAGLVTMLILWPTSKDRTAARDLDDAGIDAGIDAGTDGDADAAPAVVDLRGDVDGPAEQVIDLRAPARRR